jgi:hypothetical protein
MAANQGLLMVAGLGALVWLGMRNGGGEDGPLSFLGSGRSIGNIGGGGSDQGAAVDGVINEFGADFWGMFAQGAAAIPAAVFGTAPPTSAAGIVAEDKAERDDLDPSGERNINKGFGGLHPNMTTLEIRREVFANPASFVGETAPGQVRKSAAAEIFQRETNERFDEIVQTISDAVNPPAPNEAYGPNQIFESEERKERVSPATQARPNIAYSKPGRRGIFTVDITHGDFEFD